ncbi:zinc finger HIT domain-containing protein 2 [Pristis pectinata]|uniref:zinc finger HIT domain-containing protein 2 n=1 Tax=Pristis pectinata TaxID=685728 RepID=UPI00223DB8B9|nr:zinc finger HIT domain-containing protein 2 [Pristis pectinata]
MAGWAAGEAEAEACGLCGGPGARYTCPRCNRRYCSLPCYRGPRHRACAERFYRAAVLGELRGARAGGAERQRLQLGLRRLREAPAPGPAPDPRASASRLWAALSERQRSDFRRCLASGEAAAWVRLWRPWWEPRVRRGAPGGGEGERGLRGGTERPWRRGGGTGPPGEEEGSGGETTEGGDGETELGSDPDWETDEAVLQSAPTSLPLDSLNARPSPLIPYSVVNVLYAYAFSMRLVNGDVSGEIEAGVCLRQLGPRRFGTAPLPPALPGCLCDGGHGSPPGREQQGPSGHYTLAAISHLSRILGKAKRIPTRGGETGRDDCYRARKKCAFFLSWASEQQLALAVLSLEAQEEFRASLSHLLQVEEDKSNLEKAWGAKQPPEKRVLIEELNP